MFSYYLYCGITNSITINIESAWIILNISLKDNNLNSYFNN